MFAIFLQNTKILEILFMMILLGPAKPTQRCLKQSSTTHPGTTASSSSYGQIAVAPSGGHSFYRCINPNSWPIWRRSLQCCLYLVGPPEEVLRLHLRLSLVPGCAHPHSKGIPSSSSVFGGCDAAGGIAVVAIFHLEWGSSSPSSACPGRSYTSDTFIQYCTLCLGMERAQVAAIFSSSYCMTGTGGPQELAYGYVPAAGMLVDSSRHSGNGGKANCCSFQRRRLLLSPVSSLVVAASTAVKKPPIALFAIVMLLSEKG